MAIGGTGTEADPWTIGSAEDLVAFSADTSYWASDTYAILTADIDMDGVTGFSQIGNFTTKYQGNFDGQGHTISNLTISLPSENYVGLFGYVRGESISKKARVSRISCVGFDIAGSSYVGGLAGYAHSADILNCYSTDCIITSYSSYVGGLVGRANSGGILNCYSTDCIITSYSSYVGGLVGFAYYASVISNCVIHGGTHGNVLIGSDNGTVTNCYSSSNVSSETFHTQGFWDGTGVSGTTYLSWDFTTPVWYWDSTKHLPVLQPPSAPSAPAIRTKVAGSWKNIDKALVKVGGTWKQADKAFVKVGGAWKQT